MTGDVRRCLGHVKAVAFDLDGTIHLVGQPIAGAAEAVESVRASGRQALFITNASGRTVPEIAEGLRSLGIPAGERDVLSSAAAAGRWLAAAGLRRVWVTGTSGLRHEVEAAGARTVVNGEDPQAVVIGLDRDHVPAAHEKLLPEGLAALVARGECKLVACNRDMAYPGPDGALHPGCGEVVASVEAQCGRSADAVVGKPEPYMLLLAAADHGLDLHDILVVGDSWTSDVAMARRCGCPWLFIPAPGQPWDPPSSECAADPLGRVLAKISDLPGTLSEAGSP
jgi:4-nitrophenyl phosphatase